MSQTMRPPVIGVQLHHNSSWDQLALHLVNAMQYLKAVESATGTEHPELHAELYAIREKASAGRAKGLRVLDELAIEDPEKFRRCRSGLEPWPDEDQITFTGRCNCNDQCLHRLGVEDLGPIGVCNCDGVRPPCPVPGHPR
jgi:hypothetical protein